ncbi:predicted protein [Nematostella vectensis]|uniref:G-protein coupled receptors family 1 profile domain-containing protein n=1 Tax=Nematostella vectensis TaxID=45351 RepID=A7SSU5_NEMVE|nr:predicted protein [Nematostella vectensis]|eukprot:XP_001625300.1 predicted protein [Nematostella vectensis]
MRLTNYTLSASNGSDDETSNKEVSTATVVFKTLIFAVTICATLVGNGFIYAAMIRFRPLRTPTNLVLWSLATTDLGMVVIMVVHAVTDLSGEWIFGLVWCHVFATLGLLLSFISILHLCFLSVDRFMAIQRPLRYRQLVTRKRVCALLAILWIFPSVMANLPWSDYQFRSEVYGCQAPTHTTDKKALFKPFIFILITTFVVFPFGIMLFLHARVFRVALTHARSLSAVERSIRRNEKSDRESTSSTRKKDQEIHSLRREIKSAKTFALVIGVFLCCYIPFFTAGTYRKFAGPSAVSDVVMFITTWVAFANSCSNPLVYSLRYTPLKKAFKKLCNVQQRDPKAFVSSLNSFHISLREKRAGKTNQKDKELQTQENCL